MTKKGRSNPRFEDLDGLVFGKLTVLTCDLLTNEALVICECGTEKIVRKSSLKNGETASCGSGICHKSTQNKIGARYGYLTVVSIGRTKRDGANGTWWNCECDCGVIKEISGNSLRTGYTRSCGCKTGVLCSLKNSIPDSGSLVNSKKESYKKHAKRLNYPYSLPDSLFSDLIKGNCHYCGKAPSNKTKLNNLTGPLYYKYNGIDRKDSELGYTPTNCVSCCKNCNYAKRILSYNEFIALARRIALIHVKLH